MSAAKVVATMEVPASHQETLRPETKEFLGAAGGAAAVIKTDEKIEEQVSGDDDPIDGSEDHFSLYSMRRTICRFAWRLSILLYSSKEPR